MRYHVGTSTKLTLIASSVRPQWPISLLKEEKSTKVEKFPKGIAGGSPSEKRWIWHEGLV